jgi:anti-anti-sigma factor
MEFSINELSDYTIIKFKKHQLLGTEGVEFQNSILDLLNKQIKSIVIDLSSVDYITSWGIGMLIHAFTTSTNRNVQFSLTGVNKKVYEIFSKVKLDTVFHFRDKS